MRGCRTRQILSAGNRVFVRKFSTPTSSVKLDWRDVFEDFFGKSPSSRLSTIQPVGSATFLIDIFENAVQNKAVRKKPSNQLLSEGALQFLDEVGLPQVFEHLIESLSVDHAVVLCSKLPANYLDPGINTLIKVLLERAQQNEVDIKNQDVLADKILELVKLAQGQNCTLFKETSQSLSKWLLNSGDALSCKDKMQLLAQEIMDSPQANVSEKLTKHPLGNKCKSTEGLSNLLDNFDAADPSYKARLLTEFYGLGKSYFTGKVRESLIQLQELHLKGIPDNDLEELIQFFTKGLTEVHPSSRVIRRGVEAFKTITRSLKANTAASFNMLIAHCGNHGEIDLCIELIQTMKVRGLELCASSYEPLIKFFARTLEISKAEDILQLMERGGLRASAKAYTPLIVAHAKACNFERAFNLVENIPCEDLTADIYTPIIHAYGMKGHFSLAMSVLNHMRKKKIKPIGENFASLIHACAIGNNLKDAEKIFRIYQNGGNFTEDCHKKVIAAMLRVYAGSGNSRQLAKLMSSTDKNVLVSPEVKSSLIKGFAETGRNEEALQIYNEIRNEGGLPETGALCTLLYSLSHAGELDQLLALFEPFRKSVQGKNRVHQEELMSLACSSIVHGLILHHHLEGALTFLHRVQLEAAGDVETLCLKVFMEDKGNPTILRRTHLKGIMKDEGNLAIPQRAHLPLKKKLQFLQGMREKLRIQPTRLAYESLLESCAKEKDAHHAEAILHMMRSDKLQLNVFTYLILLRIVVGRRDLERATFLISEMRQTVGSHGLEDNHVRYVVRRILKSGNAHLLERKIYPKSEIKPVIIG